MRIIKGYLFNFNGRNLRDFQIEFFKVWGANKL